MTKPQNFTEQTVYQNTDRLPFVRDEGGGLFSEAQMSFENAKVQFTDYKKAIIIRSVSDFPTPVSNVITLDSTVVYHLDGMVDLGINSLEIPTTGAFISALNGARDISGLTTSENNHTMFVSPSGSFSGNLLIPGITITTTGTSSKVFDLDNDQNGNAIDIMGTNFVSCTSLGELTAYRQLFLDDIGFISISDGLTFNGTWSGGIACLTSIAVLFPAATLFKEGAALVIGGSVRTDINFLSVNTASVLFDFQPGNITNDAEMSLSNVRTIAADAMPNFPGSSVKARFRNCVGIINTHVGGEWTISSSAVTTISTSDTLVKMAGITTYNDLQWLSNTTDNAFVSDSNQSIAINIDASLAFTNTNNKVLGVQVRHWDNSASAYVNVGPRFTSTFNANNSIESLTILASATLDENDRIEIWIENQTDTSNITGEPGGLVRISERAS